MSLEKNMKSTALIDGAATAPSINNAPEALQGRGAQYFKSETELFLAKYGRYAADVVNARAKGLFDNAEAWTPIQVRLADIVKGSTATGKGYDDFKQMRIISPQVDYLQPGTLLEIMGSYWLAVNPQNLSSGLENTVIRRCNAAWRYLDYYGNVCTEPLCVENARASANDPDSQESVNIVKGYFNVLCRKTAHTAQINDNTRLILGSRAYTVTGYADFLREFTTDETSCRLLSFTIRLGEVRETDDLERQLADGRRFSWTLAVAGLPQLQAGQSAAFSASSVRNGAAVTATAQAPIAYRWRTSDEAVAQVDENGTVTAVAEGTADITAVLVQNETIVKTVSLAVTNAATSAQVVFLSAVPQKLEIGQETLLQAAYFDGVQTDAPILWRVDGAPQRAYSFTVDGNRARLKCFAGSETPILITAKHGDCEASASVVLEGF